MSNRLDFAFKHIYDSRQVGITIKATLRRNELFAREFGEHLDIEIESGYRQNLSTLAGDFVALGHEIELETLNLKFDTFVYFAEDYAIKRNLLDRNGWLNLVKIALNDYASEI